jgi:hypothetical protein
VKPFATNIARNPVIQPIRNTPILLRQASNSTAALLCCFVVLFCSNERLVKFCVALELFPSFNNFSIFCFQFISQLFQLLLWIVIVIQSNCMLVYVPTTLLECLVDSHHHTQSNVKLWRTDVCNRNRKELMQRNRMSGDAFSANIISIVDIGLQQAVQKFFRFIPTYHCFQTCLHHETEGTQKMCSRPLMSKNMK